MQPFRLSSLVVLAALVCTGAAIKCYKGHVGTNNTVECTGSCMRSSISAPNGTTINLGCSEANREETCAAMDMGVVTGAVCACNSDYCNTSPPTSLPSLLFIPLLSSFTLHYY